MSHTIIWLSDLNVLFDWKHYIDTHRQPGVATQADAVAHFRSQGFAAKHETFSHTLALSDLMVLPSLQACMDFDYYYHSNEDINKAQNKSKHHLLNHYINAGHKQNRKCHQDTRPFMSHVVRHQSLVHRAFNVYSTYGDDGMVEHVCERMKMVNGRFAQFGSRQSGIVCGLLAQKKWQGCFIENNALSRAALKQALRSDLYGKYVAATEYDDDDDDFLTTLDKLHKQRPNGECLDVLSVDVEGHEHKIIEKLPEHSLPKLLIVACGFLWHPSTTKMMQQFGDGAQPARQPLTVLVRAAEKRGYEPIGFNGNLYLVPKKCLDLFADVPLTVHRMWQDAFYSPILDRQARKAIVDARKTSVPVQEREGIRSLFPYERHNVKGATQRPRIVVGMTTVPDTVHALRKTLESIHNQTLRADLIHIAIPRFYPRLDKHSDKGAYEWLLSDPRIHVHFVDDDDGPILKLLTVMRNEPKLHGETRIILADDDVVFDQHCFEVLYAKSLEFPDHALGFCGRQNLDNRLLGLGSEVEVSYLEAWSGNMYCAKHLPPICDFERFLHQDPEFRWNDDLIIGAVVKVPRLVLAECKNRYQVEALHSKSLCLSNTGNHSPNPRDDYIYPRIKHELRLFQRNEMATPNRQYPLWCEIVTAHKSL